MLVLSLYLGLLLVYQNMKENPVLNHLLVLTCFSCLLLLYTEYARVLFQHISNLNIALYMDTFGHCRELWPSKTVCSKQESPGLNPSSAFSYSETYVRY